jgi:hypothetical protein
MNQYHEKRKNLSTFPLRKPVPPPATAKWFLNAGIAMPGYHGYDSSELSHGQYSRSIWSRVAFLASQLVLVETGCGRSTLCLAESGHTYTPRSTPVRRMKRSGPETPCRRPPYKYDLLFIGNDEA